MSTPSKRRTAEAVIRHAERIMPSERREWAEAMRAEIEYIDNDNMALSFAIGCLWAGYIERIKPMKTLMTVGRWSCGIVMLAGGLSKVYFATSNIRWLPGWQDMAMYGQGLLYFGAAIALFRWWPRALVLLAASALGAVGLGWLALNLTPKPIYIYSRALIIEDSVILAAIFAVGAISWLIFHSKRAARL